MYKVVCLRELGERDVSHALQCKMKSIHWVFA